MSLISYSSTDDDEDYPSSDNDHLFMKDSPRRQSNGTSSPPSSNANDQSTQTPKSSYAESPNPHLYLSQSFLYRLRRFFSSSIQPRRTRHLE
ncbi:hypothetical protein KCU91_g14956, partial [Aureobasidium melanogenum]